MLKGFLTFIFFVSFMTSNALTAQSADKKYEKAILAGGCFWGVQDLINNLDGVVDSQVGYIGGVIANPTYDIISSGLTNYAESIEIVFDPKIISYETILKFFFTIHDPTTLNRQQNDVGTQYRSEIFYINDAQKEIAENVIFRANASGVFKSPIVTQISKAGRFYLAEEYHQDYLKKNPYGYTCHHVRQDWKF